MKTAMSKTAAIKHARASVAMIQMGRQWQVNTYDDARNAWWQGHPEDYSKARRTYASALIRYALAIMGKNEDEIFSAEYDYQQNGGNWTSYLPA